jgi:large subunit ribosomal protein L32
MGAVPKSRISPRRRRARRTHDKAAPVNLVRCETCSELRQAHRVCPACGSYRGVQVLPVVEGS